MQTRIAVVLCFLAVAGSARADESPWAAPQAPAVPEADGYVVIPDAAIPAAPAHVYKAVFDATTAAEKPDQLLPAVNMLGSELNALTASGVPAPNARFVLIIHAAATPGILSDKAYRARFGVGNPNLPVFRELQAAGIPVYVCGQQLAFDRIDRKTVTPEVQVASDALIVLMTLQNQGYALLSF